MTRRHYVVVAVFFVFMLLHQSDKLLIGSLTTPVMETFRINEAQMGLVSTAAMIIAVALYPVWGYLADRFSRPRVIALASAIWGSTTWLSAVAPTYPAFIATRASTGIDDNAYPGIYSLVSDYYPPTARGRALAVLQTTAPLGYLVGTAVALGLRDQIGWRGVYYLTGGLGLLTAALIWALVREVPRGQSEPEMAGRTRMPVEQFNWKELRALLRKPTFLLIVTQGFFGVVPWNAISFWFVRYLERERGYGADRIMLVMASAVVAMTLGHLVAGAVGDWAFRRTLRGRLMVSASGVVAGMVLLWAAMSVPAEEFGWFWALAAAAALVMPFSGPNTAATVYDITPPEIRSSAEALRSFLEGSGASLAPLVTGIVATRTSLGDGILWISVITWGLCAFFFLFAIRTLPADIRALRALMRERAAAAPAGV